ncbi:MAG TPA: 5'-methylthioadenosine/adenosylhomocysteine nucleosidase [Saprospiraceae bacterium]|nr:5'-methylthioadenosine/adenosylhomocysteine nucleosidase [Saprospiraceae bacterium]
MIIGIMGAMTQEIELLLPKIADAFYHRVGVRTFITGKIKDQEVVVVFSRMGKVAASTTATILIERFHVKVIVFSGVAGAISHKLKIGDIVISEQLVQYDMDASALPEFGKFEIPLLGKGFLDSNCGLVDKAQKAAIDYVREDLVNDVGKKTLHSFGIEKPQVYRGLIGSGDQFIASKEASEQLRSDLPELLCVEMEGAAVAQVAVENEIPFVVVRTISDRADHDAHLDFPIFVDQIASHFTCGVVKRLLEIL